MSGSRRIPRAVLSGGARILGHLVDWTRAQTVRVRFADSPTNQLQSGQPDAVELTR